jgi:hypothetical protein
MMKALESISSFHACWLVPFCGISFVTRSHWRHAYSKLLFEAAELRDSGALAISSLPLESLTH